MLACGPVSNAAAGTAASARRAATETAATSDRCMDVTPRKSASAPGNVERLPEDRALSCAFRRPRDAARRRVLLITRRRRTSRAIRSTEYTKPLEVLACDALSRSL